MTITTINPSSGEVIAHYDENGPEELESTLDGCARAATAWAAQPIKVRTGALRSLAQVMRERSEQLASIATEEMGKPLAEARSEVAKCAWTLDWFADNAARLLMAEPAPIGALDSYVEFTPLGVILAIMPWNFPYWQVIRAVAPALAVGNAMLLKHAENTTGCGYALVDAARSAGVPEGVLAQVVVGIDAIPAVIADRRVAAVTLTGSTRAGRAVAALAGQSLKKSVLELGGSDPFIVLADADLEAAADWAVRSRFQNAGQSCIAAKRAIVVESVAEEFTDRLVAHVSGLVVGDPTEPATTVGPLARADLLDALERQVRSSVAGGARVLTGGERLKRQGYFFAPTVLDQVSPSMAVMREEVFGPALPLVKVAGVEEAVEVANSTTYGLGSAVWTSDLEMGRSVARRLQAGHTVINGMTASDARLPFGGVKDSGYGRELSHFGLMEFVDIHAVVINGPAGPVSPPPAAE